jgi:hypothetical protein
MNKTITIQLLLIFILIATASAQVIHYYNLDLQYNHGGITYSSMYVEPSLKQQPIPSGEFIAEIVSSDNEILNITFFAFPLTLFYDTIDPETGEINGGGMIELNESNTTLYLPYYENAVEINIYDWDLNKKLTIDLNQYVKEESIEEIETTTSTDLDKESTEKQSEEIEQQQSIQLILISSLILLTLIIILIKLTKKK